MGLYHFSIMFVCKLCRGSFQNIDHFIYHKKEKHFNEFRQIRCLVFEESALELDSDSASFPQLKVDFDLFNPNNEQSLPGPSNSKGDASPPWIIQDVKSDYRKHNDNNNEEPIEVLGIDTTLQSESQCSETLSDGFMDADTAIEDFESDFIPQNFVEANLNSVNSTESEAVITIQNEKPVADSKPRPKAKPKPKPKGRPRNRNLKVLKAKSASISIVSSTSIPQHDPYVLVRRLTRREITAAISDSSNFPVPSTAPSTSRRTKPRSRSKKSNNNNNDETNFPLFDLQGLSYSDSEEDEVSDDLGDADYDVDCGSDNEWEIDLRVGTRRSSKRKRRSCQNQKAQIIQRDERYNSHGQFIFPFWEDEEEHNADPLTLKDWLSQQRELSASSGDGNIILLSPEPQEGTSLTNPDPNSDDPPKISCKICCEELKTDHELKIHVKYCWLFNKKKHRYCIICNKTFTESKGMRKHVLLSHGPEEVRAKGYSFRCILCSEEFIKESELIHHKKTHENANSNKDDPDQPGPSISFPCHLCDKSFYSQGALNNHFKTHSEDRPHVCPKANCGRSFKFRDNLKSHLKIHEKVKATLEDKKKAEERLRKEMDPAPLAEWLRCQRSKEGNTNIILIDPDPTDLPENEPFLITALTPITCKLCSEKIDSEFEVKVHVSKCFSQNQRKHRFCLKCNQGFSSVATLRLHVVRYHGTAEEKAEKLQKFQCDLCPKKFPYRFALKLHEDTHKTKEEREASRQYICEFCARACLSRGDLNKHVRIHYEDRPFKCQYAGCKQSFKMKRGLRSHMQLTHCDLKPFNCTVAFCEKSFKSPHQLKQHLVTHTGERLYQCEEYNCGKKFASMGILRRHIKARHGDGDGEFPCEHCSKRFRLKAYLVSHMLVHSEEKPLKCPWEGCNLSFKRKREVTEHERSHTGEQPYQCDTCGKAFSRMAHFHRHMRTHKLLELD